MSRSRFLWRGKSLIGVFPEGPEGSFKRSRKGVRRVLCYEDELRRIPEAQQEEWINKLWHAKRWEILNGDAIEARERDKKRRALRRSRVSEASKAWLEDVRARQQRGTWIKYKASLNLFMNLVGDCLLSELGRSHNHEFIAKLQSHPSIRPPHDPISLNTQNMHLRHLQIFLTWCYEMEYMERHLHLKKPTIPHKDMDVISIEDLDRLEKHLVKLQGTGRDARSDRRHRNLLRAFMLARHTLLRSGHLWSLMLDRIDLKQRVIRIENNAELKWQAKGLKWPRKPINDVLFDWLVEDLKSRAPGERYYLDNGHGGPWFSDPTGLGRSLGKEMEKLGFPAGIKPFHHGIRATGITWLLNNGTPPQQVQQLADHSDIATTMKYYNTRQASQLSAVNQLAGLSGGIKRK